MNIKVIVDGKIKEPYFRAGVDEFKKRISGFVDLKIVETSKILEHVKQNSFLVTLEIDGQMLSSEEFAQKIREIELEGHYNEIVFAIGASDGLAEEVKAVSNFRFSLSRLTFLHQEAVFILVEQIYRAFKILNGGTYHK